MRAITIRQPWAWAIIHGGKDVENRSRNIAGAYRGLVAIHAAKGWAGDGALAEVERLAGWDAAPDGFILGNIIGVVDLWHVIEPHERCDYCSAWAMDDHWQLCLRNPRPLAKPIPYRGALGLWTLPDDVLAGAL